MEHENIDWIVGMHMCVPICESLSAGKLDVEMDGQEAHSVNYGAYLRIDIFAATVP